MIDAGLHKMSSKKIKSTTYHKQQLNKMLAKMLTNEHED